MGLSALFNRSADRGVRAGQRRLRALLTRADSLFELPSLLEKPEGTRVVVVSPHADDETFACGGTLYKHHLAGDNVTAVFMTDGGRGCEFAGGISGQRLTELREQEARTAAAILGINGCIFLRNPDTFLQCSLRTIRQLGQVLESLRPDIVYAPSPLDSHRDHRQACAIAARALAGCSWPVRVYLYEIWTPVPADCAVVIDLEHKIQAMRIYRSQMDERELYVVAMTGLARYRGVTCLPGQGVSVECFRRLERASFVDLAQNIA